MREVPFVNVQQRDREHRENSYAFEEHDLPRLVFRRGGPRQEFDHVLRHLRFGRLGAIFVLEHVVAQYLRAKRGVEETWLRPDLTLELPDESKLTIPSFSSCDD